MRDVRSPQTTNPEPRRELYNYPLKMHPFGQYWALRLMNQYTSFRIGQL